MFLFRVFFCSRDAAPSVCKESHVLEPFAVDGRLDKEVLASLTDEQALEVLNREALFSGLTSEPWHRDSFLGKVVRDSSSLVTGASAFKMSFEVAGPAKREGEKENKGRGNHTEAVIRAFEEVCALNMSTYHPKNYCINIPVLYCTVHICK